MLGISLVTNLAAGLAGQSLSHAEVLEAGRVSAAGWVRCWLRSCRACRPPEARHPCEVGVWRRLMDVVG